MRLMAFVPLLLTGFALAASPTNKPPAPTRVSVNMWSPEGTPAGHPGLGRSKGSGLIAVNSRPEGAVVFIDERYVGRTPLEIRVTPGQHEMKVSLYGYRSVTETFNNGSSPRLVFAPFLSPLPSELQLTIQGASAFTNAFVEDLDSGARVGGDSFEPQGSGVYRVPLKPGRYRVEAGAAERKNTNAEFSLIPGSGASVTLFLPPAIRKWMMVDSFAGPGSGDGELNLPQGMALSGNQLLVADSGNGRLMVFNTEGKFLQQVKPAGDNGFTFPVGVAFAPGPVVSDSRRNRLVFLNADFSFASATSPNEPYRVPMGLGGRVGQVALADSENNAIQLLRDETLTASISNAGLLNPSDVKWLDNGNLAVSDWGNQRLVILSREGRVVVQQALGFAPGQLGLDSKGRLWVPTGASQEVKVFNSSLEALFSVSLPDGSYPMAVVCGETRVYISARDAGKILVLEERVP